MENGKGVNSANIRSIAELSPRTKAIVMTGTLLGMFTAAMDQTIVATSLPRIVASLGGIGMFPWVFTAFMITFTVSVPIAGKLTDIYGRKPFYMTGIVILLLGSALAGSSQSMEMLIGFRVIQGLGAGMILGIAFAIVGDVFPPAKRAKWNGLLTAVFAVASIAGPLIGGYLTDNIDWRWVFYVNIPLGSIAFSILFWGMPTLKPVKNRASLDIKGVCLLIPAVVTLLLALSWGGSRFQWLSIEIIALLVMSGVVTSLFFWSQHSARDPLIPLRLFRNSIFRVSIIVVFLSSIALLGAIAFMPLFVQGVTGASATDSGLITLPMMVAVAVSSTIVGQIVSRVGRYRVTVIIGLAIMVLGSFLLSQMGQGTSRELIAINMLIFGIGLGTSMPLFLLIVQNSVPFSVMGLATSSVQFFRFMGGAVGVSVMGSLVNAGLARELASKTSLLEINNQLPTDLTELMRDPQVLLSPDDLASARDRFAVFENGDMLFSQAVMDLRSGLAVSVGDAFFWLVIIVIIALIGTVFLKEIPLRKQQFDHEASGKDEAEA